VPKDDQPGALQPTRWSAWENVAPNEFSRKDAPIEAVVVPHDLRTMELPERPWRNIRGQGSATPPEPVQPAGSHR
jgi:hypothetical protein